MHDAYCTECGVGLRKSNNYCPECGHPLLSRNEPPSSWLAKRLRLAWLVGGIAAVALVVLVVSNVPLSDAEYEAQTIQHLEAAADAWDAVLAVDANGLDIDPEELAKAKALREERMTAYTDELRAVTRLNPPKAYRRQHEAMTAFLDAFVEMQEARHVAWLSEVDAVETADDYRKMWEGLRQARREEMSEREFQALEYESDQAMEYFNEIGLDSINDAWYASIYTW